MVSNEIYYMLILIPCLSVIGTTASGSELLGIIMLPSDRRVEIDLSVGHLDLFQLRSVIMSAGRYLFPRHLNSKGSP